MLTLIHDASPSLAAADAFDLLSGREDREALRQTLERAAVPWQQCPMAESRLGQPFRDVRPVLPDVWEMLIVGRVCRMNGGVYGAG